MIDHGRLFREAWVDGVKRHYQGEPKPGYVASWNEIPEWERKAAAAVCGQVLAFIEASEGATSKLSREQRGRFVSLCWNAQIYRAFEDPKPSYVADWDHLPAWQQAVDSDIFDAIEKAAP
jgi:hypothetical protein